MKHVRTLATVSVLAIASWASTGLAATPLGSASSSPLAFAFQASAPTCPTPAAAPAKPTWKDGRAEYDAFTAAASAKTPADKAKLAAEFVQKYPNSDYKNQALQMEMAAQAADPSSQAAAVNTAEQLIKSGTAQAGQLLPAYTIISFLQPTLVQPNDPNMATKMAALMQAARCGQRLLNSAPTAEQAQYGPILTKALGFAQLNTKNYTGAISTLSAAAAKNPKDALLYYWMGIAEVTRATPDFNTGIFDLARASVLAPQTTAFKTYLNTVYTSYHGASDGLQDVITTATNNTTPPAGFKVLSKVDVENAANMAAYQAALKQQENTPPPADSFIGIEWRLKRPSYADAEWKKVKGQGFELDGLVTAVTAKSVDVAVGATDPSKNTPADLRVLLAVPLGAKRPKIGENVTVDGLVSSYKPNPPDPNGQFLMTMDKGSIKGYSPKPAAAPKTAN